MDVLTDRGQNAFWSTLSRVSTLLWHRCGSPHSGSSVGPHILGPPLWVPTSGASAGSYLVIPQRVPTFWVPTSHMSIVASLWVPTVTFWVHCGFPLWSLRGSRPIVCNSTEGSHTIQVHSWFPHHIYCGAFVGSHSMEPFRGFLRCDTTVGSPHSGSRATPFPHYSDTTGGCRRICLKPSPA